MFLPYGTQMIDEISLTYEIPRVGDSGDALLQLSVPDGALYRVVDRESSLMDGEWNSVEQVESQDPLHLSFYLTPVSDDILFLTDSAEGDGSYLGTITVNGEAIDPSFTYWDWYYEDDEDPGVWYLWFQSEYNFTPLAKKTTPSRPEPSDPEPAEPQPSEPAEDVKKFMDVPEDAYFADAVDWAVAEGITAGTDETHFAPDEDCTRAQVMTMLWASAGAPEGSSPAGFEDVPADAYFAKAVAWALEKGITSGVDAKHFAPGRTVSRAEVITFLYLLAGEKTEAACPFTDVPESAYYADAVRWAYAQGVTAGTSETHFSPDAPCTRAQVVTFLYLALGEE